MSLLVGLLPGDPVRSAQMLPSLETHFWSNQAAWHATFYDFLLPSRYRVATSFASLLCAEGQLIYVDVPTV